LLYLQVTNSFNGSLQHTTKTETANRSIVLSGNYQVASDQANNKSSFTNYNAGYQYSNTVSNWTINGNVNYNTNKVLVKNTSIGPTIMVGKSMLENKIKTSFSSSYIRFYQSSAFANSNVTARLTGNYMTKSKHVFGIDLSLLKRASNDVLYPSFTEFRGGVTYGYSFSKEL